MFSALLVAVTLVALSYCGLELIERVFMIWRPRRWAKSAHFLLACGYACGALWQQYTTPGTSYGSFFEGVGVWAALTLAALVPIALFHAALFRFSKPLFQLVFDTFVERLDIKKAGVLYLRRWYLTPRFKWDPWILSWFSPKWQERLQSRYFLHLIVRSDDDRDPHDHPWPFKSRILAGMYIERVWFPQCTDDLPPEVLGDSRYYPIIGQRYWCRQAIPGVVLDNDFTHTHMVQVIEPTWTLVLAGPHAEANEQWGFWIIHPTDPTADRWIHKDEYLRTGDEIRT